MNRFEYLRPPEVFDAVREGAAGRVRYITAATNLVDLMKCNIERPLVLFDIDRVGEAGQRAGRPRAAPRARQLRAPTRPETPAWKLRPDLR